jgi:hypothetical protein
MYLTFGNKNVSQVANLIRERIYLTYGNKNVSQVANLLRERMYLTFGNKHVSQVANLLRERMCLTYGNKNVGQVASFLIIIVSIAPTSLQQQKYTILFKGYAYKTADRSRSILMWDSGSKGKNFVPTLCNISRLISWIRLKLRLTRKYPFSYFSSACSPMIRVHFYCKA